MKKRTLSLLLTAAMTATALAGCGGSQATTGESTQAEGTNSGAGASTGAGETKAEGAGAGAAEFSYPMAAGDKLSYWCELTTTVSANYASLGDTPFAKGWQKETGAQIEFLHPHRPAERTVQLDFGRRQSSGPDGVQLDGGLSRRTGEGYQGWGDSSVK